MSDSTGSEHPEIYRAKGSGNGKGWIKGQSGNPSGRPKGIEALAREHTPAALAALVRALNSDDERVAVTAASVLLDRGWGKPKQMLSGDADNPLQYVIRGPAPVSSTAEWLKHVPKMIGSDDAT